VADNMIMLGGRQLARPLRQAQGLRQALALIRLRPFCITKIFYAPADIQINQRQWKNYQPFNREKILMWRYTFLK